MVVQNALMQTLPGPSNVINIIKDATNTPRSKIKILSKKLIVNVLEISHFLYHRASLLPSQIHHSEYKMMIRNAWVIAAS